MTRIMPLLLILACLAMARTTHASTYNVVDYGAVADDGRDDSQAFRDAWSALVAAGGGTMRVPAGNFTFDRKVCLSGGAITAAIAGDGQGISQITANSTEGLLLITFTSNQAQLSIADITFLSPMPLVDTGIEVNAPVSAGGDHRSLTMENVALRTVDVAKDSYRRGIVADGMWRPRLSNVIVSGPHGPSATSATRSMAEVAYKFTHADQPAFVQCYAWSVRDGFVIGLRSASSVEPLFDECAAVGVHRAITLYPQDASAVSGVWIKNFHPNPVDYGMALDRMNNFRVEHCPFYYSPERHDIRKPDFHDLIITNCSKGLIDSNTFYFGFQRSNIVVDAASRDIQIAGNMFMIPSSGSPVRIADAASVSIMSGNHFDCAHADETNAVALWHMDSATSGSPDYVEDNDALNPRRDNHLRLYGCAISPGNPHCSPDSNAIEFSRAADYARSAKPWGGSTGMRVDGYMYFNSNIGQQYIIGSDTAFRIQTQGKTLEFLWHGQDATWRTLAVGDAVTTGVWLRVMAEVNPGNKIALLEVEGVGRDEMDIGAGYMRSATNPIILGQGGGTEFLGKLDDIMISALSGTPDADTVGGNTFAPRATDRHDAYGNAKMRATVTAMPGAASSIR